MATRLLPPMDRPNCASSCAGRNREPSRLRPWFLVAVVLFVSIGLVCVSWGYHTWFGTNLHAVVPGQIYRCAQLAPSELADVVRQLNIRTVVNLRGRCVGFAWYDRETELLTRLGVKQWDVRLSYRSPPAVPELHRLVDALETSERPILLHCRRGADRTGLAASLAILLEGGSLAEARRQFSFYYGWFPVGGPGRLPQILDWYEAWLKHQGLSHSADHLSRWVKEGYRPGHLWAEIEPLEVPKRWSVGRSPLARFRVINRSIFTWQFRTTPRVGMHLRAWLLPEDWEITDPAQLANLPSDAAGFFDATVAPGEALELAIGLPRSPEPGRYVLLVDLVDAQDGPLCTYGSTPFRMWVKVE